MTDSPTDTQAPTAESLTLDPVLAARRLPTSDRVLHEFCLKDGRPTGGSSKCRGLTIAWQDGLVGPVPADVDGVADNVNGVVPEEVLDAVLFRIQFLNKHMPCRENSLAITKLEEALHWMGARRKDREARGVADTYAP